MVFLVCFFPLSLFCAFLMRFIVLSDEAGVVHVRAVREAEVVGESTVHTDRVANDCQFGAWGWFEFGCDGSVPFVAWRVDYG